MICYMNGELIEQEALRISPFDHGFLYGLGFFETFRTYDGNVPFIEMHYERLLHTLNEYRIKMPFELMALRTIIAELVQRNGGEDGYFRVNVSAGEAAIGLAPTHYEQPNVIIFQKSLMTVPRGTEKEAVWLKTPRNTPEGVERAKGHSYGNNVLARFELPSLANAEGLFVTQFGIVAEGITSNVFWVRRGVLFTPSISTGILNGITRQVVLRLAEKLEIPVREGEFYVEDVELAEELFVTNAVQELIPISHIGNIQFAGNTGSVYERLHAAYVHVIKGV